MTLTSLIGGKHRLQIGDETIEFSPITLDKEIEFEHRLIAKTKASLQIMRSLVTPDEYISLLKAITDSYALGNYKLLGKNGLQAIQTMDGLLVLGSLLTGKTETEVAAIIRDHGAEFAETLSAVLQDSLGEKLG